MIQCNFCQIPKTKTTEYYKNIHGNVSHTLSVPGVPEDFTVLQDFIPIGEHGGHLLLMPNTHFISFAVVENQKGLGVAVDAIIQGIHAYFPSNKIFFFEHGPGFIDGEPYACGGCHVDHAHGHFLVLPEKAELSVIKSRTEKILSDCGWLDAASHCLVSKTIFTNLGLQTGIYPYLHIGMIQNDLRVASYTYIQKNNTLSIPSQLMRTVVSEIVYGHPESWYWHWKDIHMGLTPPERVEEIQRVTRELREITGWGDKQDIFVGKK